MSKRKIGIPNFFMVLGFLFFAGFFFTGLLSAGSSQSSNINGLGVLFVIIAWVFSGVMSFWLFKGFKIIIIENNGITVSSFFSKEKKTMKFSDLEFVGWHTEYFPYSKSFHIVATLYDVHGGSIEIDDLVLENFDAIMQCIPHENSRAKKRVYKNIAKDEIITSITGFGISVLSFVFLFVSFGRKMYIFESNFTLEDFFFKILFPIVHFAVVWAFLKRVLRYRKILMKKEWDKKTTKKVPLSLKEKIERGFEYSDDPVMGYYSGPWEINGQKELTEVYFHAPDEKILDSQIESFNSLLANYDILKAELGQALDKRLKLESHKYFDHLLKQPLYFSMVAILYDKRNHENLPVDHDIELIAYKTYKSFGLKRGEDIVAQISHGKIMKIMPQE